MFLELKRSKSKIFIVLWMFMSPTYLDIKNVNQQPTISNTEATVNAVICSHI